MPRCQDLTHSITTIGLNSIPGRLPKLYGSLDRRIITRLFALLRPFIPGLPDLITHVTHRATIDLDTEKTSSSVSWDDGYKNLIPRVSY